MEENKIKNEDWVTNRLNEAKVYHSMGLYDAARDIYKRILEKAPELPGHTVNRIKKIIGEIDLENPEDNGVDEPPSIENQAQKDRDFPDIEESEALLKMAVTFMENGRYEEALDELRKLFGTPMPMERYLGHTVECILRHYGPAEAPAQIDALGEGDVLGKREKAKLKFKLGIKLEKYDKTASALEMYRSARKTVPEDLEMRSALDAKIAALSKDSPYSYLLNQGWISNEDLEKASLRAKSTGKSLEAVLIDEFNIAKDDLGESLSIFYDMPFKEYESSALVAPEHFSHLDRTHLAADSWVPLAHYEDSADILVASPFDKDMLNNIQQILKKDTIHSFIGIKEDIEIYIEDFFKKLEKIKNIKNTPPEMQSSVNRITRKMKRFSPLIPEFAYTEFFVGEKSQKNKLYSLKVINSSEIGIGILVDKDNFELLDSLKKGDTVKNMTFYAEWTLIHVDAVIKHITPIDKGKHKGEFLMGVESEEIIESSQIP